MHKTYLILIAPPYDRDKVKDVFETHPSVSYWFFSIPGSIFVNTSLSAQQLSQILISKFGQHKHFVTAVSEDRWGALPADHWSFFR